MKHRFWALVLGCALSAPAVSSAKEGPSWVFFTDKGVRPQNLALGKRTIRRREKIGMTTADGLDAPVLMKYLEAVQKTGAHIRVVSKWMNAVTVQATREQLTQISQLPFVLRTEPLLSDPRDRALTFPVPSKLPTPEPAPTPAFSLFSEPEIEIGALDYGPSSKQLSQIGVPELHKQGLTGAGVTVCLLDTGFRKSHSAFRGRKILAEWDFVQGDGNVEQNLNNPNDFSDEHGTMTWSVLGGFFPGQLVGPAYGAQFLLARTEDARSESSIEEDYWVAGLEWAESGGADVVSSSLAYRWFDNPAEDHDFSQLNGTSLYISRAAQVAAERGVLIINAIGNDGLRGPSSLAAPADALDIVSVGAVDPMGQLADFSSLGPTQDGRIKPEVVAGGVRIYVATQTGFGRATGTSLSTPLVAGVAALLIESHPDWSPVRIREALIETASRSRSPQNGYGYGTVRASSANIYEPNRLAQK